MTGLPSANACPYLVMLLHALYIWGVAMLSMKSISGHLLHPCSGMLTKLVGMKTGVGGSSTRASPRLYGAIHSPPSAGVGDTHGQAYLPGPEHRDVLPASQAGLH